MDMELRISELLKRHELVASMGINQCDRKAARRNFRNLVRKYPDIAQSYGFSESDVAGAPTSLPPSGNDGNE